MSPPLTPCHSLPGSLACPSSSFSARHEASARLQNAFFPSSVKQKTWTWSDLVGERVPPLRGTVTHVSAESTLVGGDRDGNVHCWRVQRGRCPHTARMKGGHSLSGMPLDSWSKRDLKNGDRLPLGPCAEHLTRKPTCMEEVISNHLVTWDSGMSFNH